MQISVKAAAPSTAVTDAKILMPMHELPQRFSFGTPHRRIETSR
jgi:hypothetical protein